MPSKKLISSFLLLFLIIGGPLFAQNVNDPLSYGNQAVLFGDQRSLADPVTGIMPGMALGTGFSSYIDNPASAALFGESFGVFGLDFNNVNENATYLGNSRELDNFQTRVSNAGLIYKFPTERGSLVVGGGFSQYANFNRALGFSARNEENSITDLFKVSGSYSDIAFNTFATDAGEAYFQTDSGQQWDESILRLGFNDPGTFLGMQQQGEVLQSGHGGEYSAFIATEFQKNFMVGVSLGVHAGSFNYSRVFQEVDNENLYSSNFIDSSGDDVGDTDIDNILLSDNINSRFSGFRGRIGAIYKVTPFFNVGATFTLPSKISVEEDFDATIQTTFNNNVQFEDSESSRFSYSVSYPSRIGLGLAVDNLKGFSLSVASEYVDYSNTSIEFDDELFDEQLRENDFIRDTFTGVWNIRSGIEYRINPVVALRGGYAYQPSRFKGGDDDRNLASLGASFAISRTTSLDIGAQYNWWNENSSVYTYGELDYDALPQNAPPITINSVDANRTVDQIRVMATVRMRIY